MKVHADEPASTHAAPRRRPEPAGAGVTARGWGPDLRSPGALLGLQRLAGNAAVTAALAGEPAVPVQRACACGGGKEGDGPCEGCS